MDIRRFKDVILLGGYKVSTDGGRGHVPPHVCEILRNKNHNRNRFTVIQDIINK